MAFNINTKGDIVKPFDEFEPIPDGLHEVTIDKVEYTTSLTSGNKMLKVVFKIVSSGRLVFDQIMDDPTKQVNIYRLSMLLKALNITIDTEVDLRDMVKIIKPGARLVIATTTKPGSRYTNIDINKYDGYYAAEKAVEAPKVLAQASSPAPAPELDINSDDSTF